MPRGAGIASGIEVSLLTLFSSYAPPRIGLTSPISVEFADGRKLNEFKTQDFSATETEVARTDVWLEAETEKEFQVVLRDLTRAPRSADGIIRVKLALDGRPAGDGLLDGFKTWTCDSIDLQHDGVISMCPMAFSVISSWDTVDDVNNADVSREEARSIGSITAMVKFGRIVTKPSGIRRTTILADVGKILESDAKLGTMVSGNLAKATEAEAPTSCNKFKFYARKTGSHYEFRMRYCTREVIRIKLGPDKPAQSIPTPSPARASTSLSSTPVNRKRLRQPSLSLSESSSSSSSSSSSESDDAGPTPALPIDSPQYRMQAMFKAFIESQLAEAERQRKAKAAKKLSKAEAKKQKREARARRRTEKGSRAVVDLTLDSDGEKEASGGMASTAVRGVESEVASGVKLERTGK